MKHIYLESTNMLDYQASNIQQLMKERHWLHQIEPAQVIGSIYAYVRDDIKFGYNVRDTIPASQVLKDGYGQCNTKGTLLMALLRAAGIACRVHGFTIDKKLQKGALPFIPYFFAPKRIIHSWVEVLHDNRWINLEGFIIDKQYLHAVQHKFNTIQNAFSGYGIATRCLQNPPIEWNAKDSTYIQKEGIVDDFGTFHNPDVFYHQHGDNLSGFKKWLFGYCVRHFINWHVEKIRCQYS